MSSLYEPVVYNNIPLRMYGFNKVSAVELAAITERLVKPTYNAALYNMDKFQSRPSPPPRLASARCRKAPAPGKEAGERPKTPAPAPPEVVDRIVRRLTNTTTIARMAAEGAIVPVYEADAATCRPPPTSPPPASRQRRPQTAPAYSSSRGGGSRQPADDDSCCRGGGGRDKTHVARYRRPTTATRYRNFCGFCEDPKLQDYLDLDYSDDKIVDGDELNDILKRLQKPTQASTLASRQVAPPRCRRRSSVRPPDKDMPLISGLQKSRDPDEISQRLYTTPTFAISAKVHHNYEMLEQKEKRKKYVVKSAKRAK